MAEKKDLQTWDLWYPKAAATGIPFARGRMDPTKVLWVHAAPDVLTVTVYEGDRVVAFGQDLERKVSELPTTRLWIEGGEVKREDRWPISADFGNLIILPGGEVGTLLDWWNNIEGTEWRWRVEFYNEK